ncbi:YajG family lipoprotein [Oceanicoccus sagamiensis]|uniref:Lipoprotein n=1 Tax=Oceanicoccus sagamiensis TaxID=716816 RepID=A0A1X9NDC5_9GAMM|nr:YajG family lipoprotein [Oceanicoccus sagamiensis]ARN73539.1 hypothetical protein BST96_05030 [Oceanicoccus sagamiensis]
MKKVFLWLVVALLAGCAYSPQQITVSPVISTDTESYGAGRALTVSVEDARSHKELGSRGGAYKDTSLITIGNDLEEAVKRVAKAELAVQGFNVNTAAADTPNVTIIINTLKYDMPKQTVGKTIHLATELQVVATAGKETYTGNYKTNSSRETAMTPSMAQNEEMVNDMLSKTLVRLFSDPELKAFLSNI